MFESDETLRKQLKEAQASVRQQSELIQKLLIRIAEQDGEIQALRDVNAELNAELAEADTAAVDGDDDDEGAPREEPREVSVNVAVVILRERT